MSDFILPLPFRDHDLHVRYTADQLRPTIERLRAAITQDIEGPYALPRQRLAAAWRRIAELRLPRKAVPGDVLDEIERIVEMWTRAGIGGIARCAASLSDEEVEQEEAQVRWMLQRVEEAACGERVVLVPTE